MKEILDAVRLAVQPEDQDTPLPLEDEHTPIPLSEKNYHSFTREPARLTFIDGGNQEIIGAANFSLQLLRFATVTYQGREHVDRTVEEFHILVTAKRETMRVRAFPEKFTLTCTDDDAQLSTANERVSPSSVARLYRRLYELRLAKQPKRSVIDGALIPSHDKEEAFLDELDDTFGVSKTTGVRTEQGRLVAAALDQDGSWYYHPVYEGGTTVTFARLHDASEHVFRVDMQGFDESIFGQLATLADDAVFPGYPYGLIKADRLARVSNEEARSERMRFASEFGDAWNDIERYLRTEDAHDVLDNIG